MLCELRIANLALISTLALSFDSDTAGGLIVMTGETGAGKSIMLRALDMLTGGRVSADWIRSGEESCQVEALFEVAPGHQQLLDLLDQEGLRDGQTVIIKRQVTSSGRSRLFVNGSLVTARQVAELTELLVSIAGQHEHQLLLQPAQHLDCLDTFGDLWLLRQQLAETFRQWRQAGEQLENLRQADQDKEQRRDFLSFQLAEIREAAPAEGEDEILAAEKKRLKNADQLIRLSQENLSLLSGEILEMMSSLRRNMEQIVLLDPEAKTLAEEVGGYTFLAEEYIQQLRRYRDRLESDPYRLEKVVERLDLLQQLKRKYGQTLGEVLAFAERAEQELALIASMEAAIAEAEERERRLAAELTAQAQQLSASRHQAAERMAAAMQAELQSLALAGARFVVRWQEPVGALANIRVSGWDRLEFFFSANPGETERPLARVASGGELSRLMLAMKCLLARKDMVETVIFDEVDAGIGGEAAEAVARKIKELSSHHQVLCITHLPQIAARGSQHFRVAKAIDDGRTLSTVSRLAASERVAELTRMLAGDSASRQTEAWARELLEKGGALS